MNDEQNVNVTIDEQNVNVTVSGANGMSAYQIAVQNGFVGTEQEWLQSLSGGGGRYLYLYLRKFGGYIDVQDSIDTTEGVVSYSGGQTLNIEVAEGGKTFIDIERINHTKDTPLPLVTVTETGYNVSLPNVNNYFYKILVRLL